MSAFRLSAVLVLLLGIAIPLRGDDKPKNPDIKKENAGGSQREEAKSEIDSGEDGDNPIIDREADDPELVAAFGEARANFRYFWRELTWERHRIVPGLDLAYVKAPFSDRPGGKVEHMWIADARFDGKTIRGTLDSRPRALSSVKHGDEVAVPLTEISDWLYVIGDRPYGGYTVQAIRRGMSRRDRAEHDRMWGLEFGDPDDVRVCPEFGAKGGDGKPGYDPDADHPMAVNMAKSLRKVLAEKPETGREVIDDETGFTMLHLHALAGNTPQVEALVAAGADREAKCKRGRTALQLAKEAGWKRVAKMLRDAEKKQ